MSLLYAHASILDIFTAKAEISGEVKRFCVSD